MYQVVEMTDEEKFEMYMKVPHEELVRMKIEEERILKMMEKDKPMSFSDGLIATRLNKIIRTTNDNSEMSSISIETRDKTCFNFTEDMYNQLLLMISNLEKRTNNLEIKKSNKHIRCDGYGNRSSKRY